MKKERIRWIYFADDDMNLVKDIMRLRGSTGQAAVHCQQAIEKYFKGHLIEHGWELRKTHNLLDLYSEIERIQSWNLDEDSLATLADVNNVYIDDRYPGSGGNFQKIVHKKR